MPRTGCGPGGAIVTVPSASTVPSRKHTLDRCPSPIPRALITKRTLPDGTSRWSGCTTTDGLHNAAASTLYSCVNVAPSSSRCAGDKLAPEGSRSATRVAFASKTSASQRWRPSNRPWTSASASATSAESRARTRATTRDTRDSLPPPRAWPGTNRRATTRDGSGLNVGPWRTATAGEVTTRPAAAGRACWSVDTERERRLGALVRVRAVGVETVEAPARQGIPHRDAGVVVAQEPVDREGESSRPTIVTGDGRRPRARVRHRGDLDRLLVEGRRFVARPAAADGRDGEVSVVRLLLEQPAQQREAVLDEVVALQRRARGDQRVGEDGVRVGEARLGPRPRRRRRRGGRAQDRSGVREQSEGVPMTGDARHHLAGAEGREGHRPRPRRALLGPPLEVHQRHPAQPALGAAGGRGPETPQRSPPAVLDATAALPPPLSSRRLRTWPATPCASMTARKAMRASSGTGDTGRVWRQATTSSRAASSVQYPSARRGWSWSACSKIPRSSVMRARWRNVGRGGAVMRRRPRWPPAPARRARRSAPRRPTTAGLERGGRPRRPSPPLPVDR